MEWALFFHIIGMVMWIGGLFVLSRVMRVFCEPYQSANPLIPLVSRSFFGFVVAGCLLSLLSGIAQMVIGGMSLYFKQGWFHGKLTLVLVLFVISILLGLEVSKLARGEALTKGRLQSLHALTGLCFIGIVFFVIVLRRGV